ncbi:hypothetical protein [Dyadobacter sp. CY356]|uniref:hypothetical protein n=1 Tax=Dyadobacter sp. CY356 TaxID=2906442 RepID=UPI001F19D697|nr:hypothetical protein [Dyadobacter sp. CY356]MCF0054254.1 hypothetical protein [Dyadobacter sp. CY356]
MKFVKYYPAIILALMLSSVACEKGSTLPNGQKGEPDGPAIDSRLTCNWRTGSTVDSTLTSYTTEVKQVGDSMFILRASGLKKIFTGYLGACNFPKEAKKNGLILKVSGYVVTYPDITLEDIIANPFEITSYQIIK